MSEIKVSIHEKEDSTYQVSFINPLDQKRKRHIFQTKDEAERFRNDVIIQHSKGTLLPSGKRYVGHLLQSHLQRNPNSGITERKNIFTAFCSAFNHFEIEHLTKDALSHWLIALQTKNTYTDRNMCRIKTQLNHFMSWLVQEGIIQVNPLDHIRFKQNGAPKRSRVILSKDEVRSLIDHLKADSPNVLFPFIFTIIHTGARRGEIQKLKWENVDFENQFIHLKETKNGEDRQVKMSRSLYDLLKSHPRINDHVFVDEEGKPIHRAKIQRRIAKFKKDHPDQKDWKCHDLRHSFAYNFLKRGGEMYQLKAVLGHKSIQMTVDLYGNLKAGDIENPSPYDN